jgi:twitching motility protein PilT
VPAVEILVPTAGIRRAIRDRETHLIAGLIETGRSLGMQLMDGAIADLLAQGLISPAAAVAGAHNPDKMAHRVA